MAAAELADLTCPATLGARLVPAEDARAAGTVPAADVMRLPASGADAAPGDEGGGTDAGSVSEKSCRA